MKIMAKHRKILEDEGFDVDNMSDSALERAAGLLAGRGAHDEQIIDMSLGRLEKVDGSWKVRKSPA